MRQIESSLFPKKPASNRLVNYLRASGQLIWLLARDIYSGEISSQAASLAYSTLIAIVPMLAIGVSVLKLFGASNFLQTTLAQLLKPLGSEGILWAHRTATFVSHVRVGVIGGVGMVFLLITAFSLVRKVETGLNVAWQITSPRSMINRAAEYLAILVFGPVLLLTAFGLTTVLQNESVARTLGELAPVLGQIIPYVISVAAFTLVNLVTPNTRVQLKAAVIAGLAGGIVWQSIGMGFALLVSSSTKLAAVYSSFAVVILSLLWINLSWTILLLGGRLSYYIQNPKLRKAANNRSYLGAAALEQIGIGIMILAQNQFIKNRRPLKKNRLAMLLGVPERTLEPILMALTKGQLLHSIKGGGHILATEPSKITLADILIASQGSTPQILSPLCRPDELYRINARRLLDLSRLTLSDLCNNPPN